MTTIRYDLPMGDRFVISASTSERISVADDALVDLHARIALSCEVVSTHDGIADIDASFVDVDITGTAPGGHLPPLSRLRGAKVRVRKGVDGTFHEARGGDALEDVFGGLTLLNALRWFAAAFPDRPVAVGDRWSTGDLWRLRSDRTPLRVRLPVELDVEVSYAYELVSLDARRAEMRTDISFDGRGDAATALGLSVGASGAGTGIVVVDLDAGKLERSTRHATLSLSPTVVRRGALALPPLHVDRRSEASFERR